MTTQHRREAGLDDRIMVAHAAWPRGALHNQSQSFHQPLLRYRINLTTTTTIFILVNIIITMNIVN